MIYAKKSSDSKPKYLRCGGEGEQHVVLYGTTMSCELSLILVDEDGCILTTPST